MFDLRTAFERRMKFLEQLIIGYIGGNDIFDVSTSTEACNLLFRSSIHVAFVLVQTKQIASCAHIMRRHPRILQEATN